MFAAATAASDPCSPMQGIAFDDAAVLTQSGVPTDQDCCSLCTSHPACVAWTFRNALNCTLHGSSNAVAIDETSTAGFGVTGVYTGSGYACDTKNMSTFRFCDASLSASERVADLVSKVEPQEIGLQLTARQSPAIPRLGLPSYYW